MTGEIGGNRVANRDGIQRTGFHWPTGQLLAQSGLCICLIDEKNNGMHITNRDACILLLVARCITLLDWELLHVYLSMYRFTAALPKTYAIDLWVNMRDTGIYTSIYPIICR